MRLAAILWFFAYVSLETRRCFNDAAIGDLNGVSDAEVYAYSAVWLALGLALLAYGVARFSREVRYASAFFVVATTLKVFLYDLSGLEGAFALLLHRPRLGADRDRPRLSEIGVCADARGRRPNRRAALVTPRRTEARRGRARLAAGRINARSS